MRFLDPYAPYTKSLLRIVAGLVFLSFGAAKLLHIPPVPMFESIPMGSMEWFAGWIELVGGTLVLLGFFSRIAAFVCSGEMAVGYFLLHLPMSVFPVINNGSAAILFCFLFLYFAASGPGPWAINQK